MRIEDIIRSKGAGVVTVEPTATVEELVALLGEHRIGAVVVSSDGATGGASALRKAAISRRICARSTICV